LMLWMIYAVEGFLSLIAYGMNAIMTGAEAKQSCVMEYVRRADKQFVDMLTSLPNLVTSLIDLTDTVESGYANMACARTTYMARARTRRPSPSAKLLLCDANGKEQCPLHKKK